MTKPLNPEVAILNAALELPAGQRAAYLDKACRGDADLRQQVEGLLRANDQAEGFLDGAPAGLDFKKSELGGASLTEKPGDRIGRYKLLQQIGEGGCGVVYMAEQEEPVRRRVALKIIKLGMDTRQVIARFEAERQALALMDHPNIAKVFDAGATDTGRPYFVMELVRGIKITQFCDEHKLSTEERLKLFIQVCQAIQHAHQKGIIHRDIKPSNILVTVNDGVPVPKVIDFGIAKATQGRLTDRTLFTPFEQFIGTPAYMSPEQAVMTSLDVDTRGDIYSLGVLLYELITGRTPFDQNELLAGGLDEMRRTIREKEPPKPSTRLRALVAADLTTTASCRQTEPPRLIHTVRGDLDWIVMKALEKDRARRYETANGLAADVQRHLSNEPVSARPPSNWYRLQKLVQRNRLAFAAATVGAVAILLGLIILGVSNVRITRERNEKDMALKQKDAALTAAHTSEQRAREQLFVSLRSQAQARRYSRQMGQRLDGLAALSEAARIRPDPGVRDDAIAAMALPDVRHGPKLAVAQTNCVAVAFDSSYRRYALLDHGGVVIVRNIADGEEVQRFDTGSADPDSYTLLLFSPDDRFLARVQEGATPLVWLLESGESILRDVPGSASTLAFSADSRWTALAEGAILRYFDLATGREQNSWKTDGWIRSVQFNPRDRRLAVGYRDRAHVSIYDPVTGEEQAQLAIGSARTVNCWHPDGIRLAVGSSDPRIQIWDVDARRQVAALEGHTEEVDVLTFDAGGGLLASASWDVVVRLWDMATGRQAMQIPLSARLRFSKDGRWLGYFRRDEEHVQLLEVILSEEYFTLESGKGAGLEYNGCAIASDGRLLAVATSDGVGLWDLAARRQVAVVPSGPTDSVLFESDDQALLTCGSAAGLQRWPLRSSATNATEMLVAPPQRFELEWTPRRISRDRSGQVAVVSQTAGRASLVDLMAQSAPGVVVQHLQADFVALSPDGKWLATSGWHSDRVRLWNTESGKLVREWVLGVVSRVSFTPDSRQLIIGRNAEFNFVDIETLETNRRLHREIGLVAGDIAFSPDSRLMALELAPGVIHLKEISTGSTVAQLKDPQGDRSTSIIFTPDGTKLIVIASTYVAAAHAAAVHVWDLKAIRLRLKKIGLDWDWPEFPSANGPITSAKIPPLKVRVINGEAHDSPKAQR